MNSTRQKNVLKLFLILSLYLYSCNSDTTTFLGDWICEKNNEKMSFSINIQEQQENYVGTYCAIAEYGNRIDCSTDKQVSFQLKKSILTQEVEFYSYYSGTHGKVKIQLKNNKLYWIVIKQPDGEFYVPNKAVLKKQ